MARLLHLCLLLWVGVTATMAVDLEKRIIGGHNCGNNENLHHVKLKLYINQTHQFMCGGSLINDRWILTAAHCWDPAGKIYAYLNIHPNLLQKETMEILATRVKIYRDSNGNTNDIMLLQLPQKPSVQVHPVPLPTNCATDIQVNDNFQISGHGCASVNGSNHYDLGCPLTLQCAKMPVVNCTAIEPILRRVYPNTPVGNYFCTGHKQYATGPGDSGGGAVYNGSIYGVYNGGHFNQAFVIPSFFLRVCKYITWIDSVIKP